MRSVLVPNAGFPKLLTLSVLQPSQEKRFRWIFSDSHPVGYKSRWEIEQAEGADGPIYDLALAAGSTPNEISETLLKCQLEPDVEHRIGVVEVDEDDMLILEKTSRPV